MLDECTMPIYNKLSSFMLSLLLSPSTQWTPGRLNPRNLAFRKPRHLHEIVRSICSPSLDFISLLAKSPAVSAFFWPCNVDTVSACCSDMDVNTGTHDVHADLVPDRLDALVKPVSLLAALLSALAELSVLALCVVVHVIGHVDGCEDLWKS